MSLIFKGKKFLMQTEEAKKPKNRKLTQGLFSLTHSYREKGSKFEEEKNLHLNLENLPIIIAGGQGSPTSMESMGSERNSDESPSHEAADNKLKKSQSRKLSSISWGKKDKKSAEEKEKRQPAEEHTLVYESEEILATHGMFFPPPKTMLPNSSISTEFSAEKSRFFAPSGEKECKIGIQLFITCQYQQALFSFERSAEKEYQSAFVWLGIFFERGFGKKIDIIESKKWYEKAAVNIDWFKEKAKMGCVDARNNLGFLYAIGVGLEKDEEKSFIHYKYSANKGYQLAQFNLGMCYREGRGVGQDYINAAKFFQLAADQGNAMAQYQLGMCYHDGNGVIRDYKISVKCLRLSADQGYEPAQNELGLCYYNGKGVTQDYEMAAEYFQLAAKQGYAPAQNWLAFCYYEGSGVKQDYNMAVKYYQLAANQGYECARHLLKILLMKEPALININNSNKDEKNSFLNVGKKLASIR